MTIHLRRVFAKLMDSDQTSHHKPQQQLTYGNNEVPTQCKHRRTSQGAVGVVAPRLGQNHYFLGKS